MGHPLEITKVNISANLVYNENTQESSDNDVWEIHCKEMRCVIYRTSLSEGLAEIAKDIEAMNKG